jgi:hypothetical protein
LSPTSQYRAPDHLNRRAAPKSDGLYVDRVYRLTPQRQPTVLCTGKLGFALANLAALPRAALVVLPINTAV